MDETLNIAQSIGPAGLGLLAVVLAIWLAIKAVDLVRNGKNGKAMKNLLLKGLDEVRLICPLAPGKRTIDDVYDALMTVATGTERMNEKLAELVIDSKEQGRCMQESLTQLRIQVAGKQDRE